MAIPASQIVQVNPRLLQPGGTDLEMNGLIIARSEDIPLDAFVLAFPDAESVGAYFGLLSKEYLMAVTYFLGYNNSFVKPRALYIAPRVDMATAPFLRGAPNKSTVRQKIT